MDRTSILPKCIRVNEEGRHEVHGVGAVQVRMLRELGTPAVRNGILAEFAVLTGKR